MNMATNGEHAPPAPEAALMSLPMIQMLQIGIGVGTVAAGAMILYMMRAVSFTHGEVARDGLMVGVLSLVNLVLTCLLYFLAYAVPRWILRRRIRRLAQTVDNDHREEWDSASMNAFIPAFAYCRLLRLIMLDFPASFGLVVCLISSAFGAMERYPEAWLNALPTGVFLLYTIVSFPTRGRVLDAFRHQIELARQSDMFGARS